MQTFKNTRVMSVVYRMSGLLLILSMASAGYGDEVSSDEENAPVVPSNPRMTEKSASEKMGSPDATVSNDGSASYGYPILLPPGRGDVDPSLVLSYNSNNRTTNGPLGVGFSLPVPAIERSTKRGLDYNGNDFVVGGQDLTPRSSDWGDGYYGARIESAFTKYYFDSGNNKWIATTRDGIKYSYGETENSRLGFPGDSASNTFKWFLYKVEDTNGNYTVYEYQKDTWSNQSREINLKEIRYSGHVDDSGSETPPVFRVVFEYEEMGDLFTVSYKTHYATMQRQRLKRIIIYKEQTGLRLYGLHYEEIEPNAQDTEEKPTLSFLKSIEAVEVDPEVLFAPRSVTQFTWRDLGDAAWLGGMKIIPEESPELPDLTQYGRLHPGYKVLTLDYNGDGKDDILKFYLSSNIDTKGFDFRDHDHYLALFRANGLGDAGLNESSFTEFCWGTEDYEIEVEDDEGTHIEIVPGSCNDNLTASMEMIGAQLGPKEQWEFIDVVAYDYNNDGRDDLLFWAGGKKDPDFENNQTYLWPDQMWLFESQGDDSQGEPVFVLKYAGDTLLELEGDPVRFKTARILLGQDASEPTPLKTAYQRVSQVAIVPADFNSDGFQDLLIFNNYSPHKNFATYTEEGVDWPFLQPCTADPNNDGKYWGRKVWIFLSKGTALSPSEWENFDDLEDVYTEVDNEILAHGIDNKVLLPIDIENQDYCYFRDELQVLDFNGDGYSDIVIGRRPLVSDKYPFCIYEYDEQNNVFAGDIGTDKEPICKIFDFDGFPGTNPFEPIDPNDNITHYRGDAPCLSILDYNGDGLSDILLGSPTYKKLWPNSRMREFALLRWNGVDDFIPVSRCNTLDPADGFCAGELDLELYNITPIDYNQDGNTDLYFNSRYIALSLGNGDFIKLNDALTQGSANFFVSGGRGSKARNQLLDIMGSGVAQLLYQKNFFYYPIITGTSESPASGEDQKMYRAGHRRAPYLLSEIKTIHGHFEAEVTDPDLYHKKVTIAYQTSSDLPNNEMTKSVFQVVSSIDVDYGTDTNLGPFKTSYEFSGGYFDAENREFRGFDTVIKRNPDYYVEKMMYHTRDYYLQGRMHDHYIIDPMRDDCLEEPSTCPNKWISYEWDAAPHPGAGGLPSRFVGLIRKLETIQDDRDGDEVRRQVEGYTYNPECGLLVTTARQGINTPNNQVNWTTTIHENLAASEGWLWRPRREYVHGEEYGVTVDGYEHVARATFYDEYDDKGNLKKQNNLIGLDGGNKIQAELKYEYNGFGNVFKQWDPKDNLTIYEYETELNKYVSKITMPETRNIEDEADTTNHIVMYEEYNYKYGVPKKYIDENGKVTETDYDALGRKSEVHFPHYEAGAITDYKYEDRAFPRYTEEWVHVGNDFDSIDTRTYIDGDGRTLQIIAKTADDPATPGIDRYTSRISLYDSMGRNDWNYGPYHCSTRDFFTTSGYADACPYQDRWQQNEYDFLGRTRQTNMPYDPEDADQAVGDITITYIYEGWDTTIIDPDGKYKRVTGDNLGRTVSVYEFIDALEKETEYKYNAAGDLRRIHLFDPERSRTWFIKFFYDSLGRKTETHDPNMGTWFYEYDDNGNMTELEDAKGNIIAFEYDALNRPQKKTSMTADATVEDEVINIYDKSPNGKGRLYISKNNNDGDDNYGVEIMVDAYDEMGNVLSETKTLRDPDFEEAYTTEITYDKSGKPIEMIYPASPGETPLEVETTYHAGTSLVAMVLSDEATPTTYANFSDYDASGKIKTAMYGYEPGDGDYATRTDYHYRPATGRLGEIRTIQGNLINDPDNPETILQNKVYNYTKAGDVSRISTIVNRNMQVYEYEYDDLHRLTAERRIGSVPSNVIERYDNEFEGPQAHAVSSTVHQLTYGTMPYEVSYDYDENGNLTSKEEVNQWAQPGITVTLNKTDVTYTVENLPKSIVRFTDDDGDGSGTEVYTDFLYDPAGRRIRKHTQPPAWEEYKYYISEGFEVTRLPGANAIVDTNYIFAGNQRVAKVTDGEVVYIHKDHLGSTTVVTDNLGNPDPDQPLTQYRPYGLQRADSELSGKTDYGFTDQEFDKTTGFYNYDARLYNPEVGMFNTPDGLLQNVYDPQFLNRYAYVRNNPIKYIDPSGNLSVSTRRYALIMGNPEGAESGKESAENVKKTTGEKTREITIITPTKTIRATVDSNGNIISISESPTLYAELDVDVDEPEASWEDYESGVEDVKRDQNDIKRREAAAYWKKWEKGFETYRKIREEAQQQMIEDIQAVFAIQEGTPKSNQAQKRQFDAATRGLTKKQKKIVHREIHGQNYSYKEIKEIAEAVKRGEY